MNVLIACECSGAVRTAFRALGHDAWSCDLKPAEDGSCWHLQQDIFDAIEETQWDLLIAHPPCTYLSSSGLHWNKRRPERAKLTAEAVTFAARLFTADIHKIAIENPVGCLSTRIRKPDQIIQPYQFGHDASKGTCLWLQNLPLLKHTKHVAPRMVNGRPRWANQTDSGQNKLGPSPTRAADRARTYQGIADAMAAQWGGDVTT